MLEVSIHSPQGSEVSSVTLTGKEVLVLISIGKEYHEGDRFYKTLMWLRKAQAQVTFILDCGLQRRSLSTDLKPSVDSLLAYRGFPLVTLKKRIPAEIITKHLDENTLPLNDFLTIKNAELLGKIINATLEASDYQISQLLLKLIYQDTQHDLGFEHHDLMAKDLTYTEVCQNLDLRILLKYIDKSFVEQIIPTELAEFNEKYKLPSISAQQLEDIISLVVNSSDNKYTKKSLLINILLHEMAYDEAVQKGREWLARNQSQMENILGKDNFSYQFWDQARQDISQETRASMSSVLNNISYQQARQDAGNAYLLSHYSQNQPNFLKVNSISDTYDTHLYIDNECEVFLNLANAKKIVNDEVTNRYVCALYPKTGKPQQKMHQCFTLTAGNAFPFYDIKFTNKKPHLTVVDNKKTPESKSNLPLQNPPLKLVGFFKPSTSNNDCIVDVTDNRLKLALRHIFAKFDKLSDVKKKQSYFDFADHYGEVLYYLYQTQSNEQEGLKLRGDFELDLLNKTANQARIPLNELDYLIREAIIINHSKVNPDLRNNIVTELLNLYTPVVENINNANEFNTTNTTPTNSQGY